MNNFLNLNIFSDLLTDKDKETIQTFNDDVRKRKIEIRNLTYVPEFAEVKK